MIEKINARAAQALAIASGARFPAIIGDVSVLAATLCIHSDSPGAAETARAVRNVLAAAAIDVAPFAIDRR